MTSALLTPWWRARSARGARQDRPGGCAPTAILDWRSAPVAALVRESRADESRADESRVDVIVTLQRAHRAIASRVRPVYALDESQAASRTLAVRRGSCSQRLAILECVARSIGVPTRVRGLLVDGRFWYPRFPRLHVAVPDEVLVAWPEFRIDGTWLSAPGLFGHTETADAGSRGAGGVAPFTNADGETLFDAVARTTVDWDGATSAPGTCSACDLSGTVLRDLGRFDSRDALFSAHGQTLSWPARTVAGPVLGRWSASRPPHR